MNINLTVIDDFLTLEECNLLISLKKDSLARSTVVDNDTFKGVQHDARTSEGAFFKKHENELITFISHRLAWLTRTNHEQQEGFQFLHYGIDEQYKYHHDYFKNDDPALERGGNRIFTALLYLNSPDLGGETYLPHYHKIVEAKAGRLVYWRNLDDNFQKIEESLHAGLPVISGEKYCMPVWIRQSEFI